MHNFNLKNGAVVSFGETSGRIYDILYNGQHLVKNNVPVFSVKLRDRNGKSRLVLSEECTFIKTEGNSFFYRHDELDCELIIKQEENTLRFRINITNKTGDLLEWVELMSFGVINKLQDEENGKGVIAVPYNEGCLVTNMEYRESMPFRYTEPDYPSKNTFSIFPNMITSQFITYMCGGAGIYLGMEDAERTPKHIDYCYYKDSIKVFMRTFCNLNYGESYGMPFDSVLAVYDGGWKDACEIYRNWFYGNLPEGLIKIKDNKDLPEWYNDSPLVVAYPVRGDRDTNMIDNGYFPYNNILSLLDEISDKTDSRIMALLMQWEGTAQWAPPYVWPPLGGEKLFVNFVNEIHKRNMLIGLYASGFGYTIQSNIDKEYNQEKKFEEDGIRGIVCENTDHEAKSITCLAQRTGYDLCPANDKTKKIISEEIEKVAGSGVDYMQALDQNHGGSPYFCYSDRHGHIPAPGKWQVEETNKLLDGVKKGNMLLGCESAASEPFIKNLKFSDNRYQLNFYCGQPVPMYAYIYHEFVNNFMGNQICSMIEKKENNATYRLAYSFICGDILTLTVVNDELKYSWCDWIQPEEKNVDKNTALPFIKTLNAWRKGKLDNFLHYGKMVKGIEYGCTDEKFMTEGGVYLRVKSVLSSAFEINGEKYQFLTNYNLHPVSVEFEKAADVYLDSNLTDFKAGVKTIDIPALSVIAVKL